MAFPSIPTSAGGRILSVASTAGGATNTFPSLTGLTKNAGDLLIAIIVIYDGNSTNDEFSSWGGGFTEFVDQATTATMGIGCAYKFSTGSETGTFTVTSADASTTDRQMILLSIAGAHASTPPEGGTIANGTSTNAAIAALNPSGWAAEDTLWIAVGGWGETSTSGSATGISGVPTNYGSEYTAILSADAVGGVEAVVAFRQLNAASDDPDAFNNDTSNGRNSALLLAVRPAAVESTPGSVSPGAISRSFAVNAVTVKGAAKTAPAATSRSFTVNAATVKGTATVQPGAVTRSFTLGAVTAGDSGAAGSVNPDPLTLAVTVPAPTVKGAAETNPAVMTLAFNAAAVSVKGAAVRSPAAITLSAVIPQAAAVDSGDAGSVTPSTISRALTLPSPTIRGAAAAEPGTISRSVTVNVPTVRGAGEVAPATIARSFTVLSASARISAQTTPNAISRAFTLPGVSITSAAGVTPDSIILVVTIPATSILVPAEYTWQEGGLTVIIQQGAASSNAHQGASVSSGSSGGITVGGTQE